MFKVINIQDEYADDVMNVFKVSIETQTSTVSVDVFLGLLLIKKFIIIC